MSENGLENGIHVMDDNAPAPPQMVVSEEEANEIFRSQYGHDPKKMRAAAAEIAAKIHAMADEMDGGPSDASSPAHASPPPMHGMPNATHVTQVTQVTDQAPAHAPAPLAVAHKPPTGYMPLTEGLYHWTPEAWGERPLHAIPDYLIEKAGRPTLIIFVLLAPAFAHDRSGKVVSLPEGARVVVHASIAWAPILPLVKGPLGRPVLWAAPTGMKYATGDGGFEHGISITYDPDPRDPSRPRLITLETLRGVRPEE